jgi:prepilin peptidase CpaA
VIQVFGDMWLVLVILFGGACYDMKEHRVPNWWVISAMLCGLGLCILTAAQGQELPAVLRYMARLMAVTAVLFPLFRFRVMGAGDIKMMAVITGCMGFAAGIKAIACGFLIGAVLALVKMLIQKSLFKRLAYLTAYIRRLFLTKEIVPYYVAGRDGNQAVIPFTLCLFLGYLWYMMMI